MKQKIRIGIDPGTNTGVAVSIDDVLESVNTFTILKAIDFVETLMVMSPTSTFEIVIEDATRRGGEKKKAFGAGHVCRDTKIWKEWAEQFKDEKDIVVKFMKPTKNPVAKRCKKDGPYFNKITGWKKVSSEHGRDACSLIGLPKVGR